MLSGVSLTNEKSYLIGKFARLALHTANLDYNGRFCMVSAGAGNKKALGVDRAPNPWSDIPLADVVWVAGSNVAETFPITTSYIWRARDRGAKLIVQDPRVVPLARTADLFLPGPARARDSALFGAVLHELIRHDWLDHDFIDAHTVGFDEAAAAVADMTPAWAAEITGVPAARIEEAAELWGTSATGMMLHARGIEQQTKGVDNVLAAINLGLATGKFGKPGCGVSTITGQGNGQGGREHGHKCDQLPGNRDITNPEHRAAVAKVWGCDESRDPRQGHPRPGDHRGDPRRRDQGAAVDLLQPGGVGTRRNFTGEALDKLEFYSVIDFFLSESAQHADVVLPGSLHEEDEGTSTSGEGRIIKINAAVTPPGEARLDWQILLDIAERLGKGEYFPYANTEEIFEELCLASPGGTADYTGATWERIEDEMGLFWPIPEVGHPGTPRLFEGGQVLPPRRQGPLPRRAVPRVGRGRRRRVPDLAHHRPGRQPVPVGHPDPPHRRRSSSSTPSRCARCTRSSPSSSASPTATRSPSPRGAATMTLPAHVVNTIRPDTVFIPYHWPGDKAANQLTNRAVDPLSKMPEFKVAAVRIEPPTADRDGRRRDLDLHEGPAVSATASTTSRCSSSTRAAASAARPACRPAWSAAPTGASRSSTSNASTGPPAPRPRPWCACTARTRPAPRCAPPTPSSRPRTASCSPRSSPAASAARTACSPARSASPSTSPSSTR